MCGTVQAADKASTVPEGKGALVVGGRGDDRLIAYLPALPPKTPIRPLLHLCDQIQN